MVRFVIILIKFYVGPMFYVCMYQKKTARLKDTVNTTQEETIPGMVLCLVTLIDL